MPDRTVFVNGKVFVGDAARSWARAVAVEGGRIVAVGNEAEVGYFSAGADLVDLEGRLLTPGFTDAHVHPHHGGEKLLGCNLLDAPDREAAMAIVADYVATHPGDDWVKGGGWSQDWFPNACPSATELDAVVGERPVFFGNRDGHGGWASSAALRLAGVTSATADPPDGRIERLPDGSPQGTFHEGAMALIESAMPAPTAEEDIAALRAGQDHLLSFGITGWMDAWVDEPLHRAYRVLAERGELKGSVLGALWWDRSGGLDQIDRLRSWREQWVEGYRPTAVKLMLDGVVENFTASMLEPYDRVGGTGIDMIDPADLKEIVTRLDALGFQCHFHAIGDAAVRNGLDAVEAARMANGWSDLRHSISHLQVVHPQDIGRFHRLGVIANIQPLWACEDGYQAELTQPFLGRQRSEWQYPFGALVAAGATMAGGSDWSVSTCDVMEQVHVATTRVPAGDRGYPPLTPDQRIDPVSALGAFTAGSAWHNHDEARRGSVTVGNVADLVILDRNPFEDGDFAATKVDMVMAGGDWVGRKEA
ncbi:MAG TPA: amidohydrolase [Acidimicrobiia bacterium]|nr:amidohydrolase [Acidimicrobiia bacterium]